MVWSQQARQAAILARKAKAKGAAAKSAYLKSGAWFKRPGPSKASKAGGGNNKAWFKPKAKAAPSAPAATPAPAQPKKGKGMSKPEPDLKAAQAKFDQTHANMTKSAQQAAGGMKQPGTHDEYIKHMQDQQAKNKAAMDASRAKAEASKPKQSAPAPAKDTSKEKLVPAHGYKTKPLADKKKGPGWGTLTTKKPSPNFKMTHAGGRGGTNTPFKSKQAAPSGSKPSAPSGSKKAAAAPPTNKHSFRVRVGDRHIRVKAAGATREEAKGKLMKSKEFASKAREFVKANPVRTKPAVGSDNWIKGKAKAAWGKVKSWGKAVKKKITGNEWSDQAKYLAELSITKNNAAIVAAGSAITRAGASLATRAAVGVGAALAKKAVSKKKKPTGNMGVKGMKKGIRKPKPVSSPTAPKPNRLAPAVYMNAFAQIVGSSDMAGAVKQGMHIDSGMKLAEELATWLGHPEDRGFADRSDKIRRVVPKLHKAVMDMNREM